MDQVHRPQAVGQAVVVIQPGFQIAALEAGVEVGCGVGGYLLAEQVHGNGVMEIDVSLEGLQVDGPAFANPLSANEAN